MNFILKLNFVISFMIVQKRTRLLTMALASFFVNITGGTCAVYQGCDRNL